MDGLGLRRSMTNSHKLVVERQFVPISQGEALERSSRLRALLLKGAKRLVAEQRKGAGCGLEETSCN
jgi:hypothetical protein